MFSTKAAVYLLAAALASPAQAEEPGAAQPAAPEVRQEDDRKFGETISVTATRSARRTRDVPQAIAVIGKEQMEDKVVFNVKDVVQGTPGVLVETKNGGYDARLLIRGAGLKATYGVREIMLLRDGVPLTDPDSFTRLDWIDMQDVERIEVAKGPGNLFSPGSAGGAVQILSRSVFDAGADTARVTVGTFGSGTAHLRTSRAIGSNALALTASYRRQENQWRLWNEFSTFQLSLKHGVRLADESTVETEVAYNRAEAQLPGVMDQALYDTFVRTGEQRATSEPWKNSGRYSQTVIANSKLERRIGDVLLKPRVYYTQWTHVHPVTGFINHPDGWSRTLGTDLEGQHAHALLGVDGTLVAGVTAKGQWDGDARRYEYRDVTTSPTTGRITATLSDAEGALMQTGSQRNVLLGAFAQETLRPHERVLVDAGIRLDRSWMHVNEDELIRYDYALGSYQPGTGRSTTDKVFDLPAPKLGVSVRLTSSLTAYASAARASQIPSTQEIVANPGLDAAVTTSYETGAKLRASWATLDLAGYWMDVRDEIVQSLQDGESRFLNAGETRKRGVEASASFRIVDGLEAGASYGYADYRYVSFEEVVRGVPVERDGNRLPYVPQHQYGAFASWRHATGLRLRVQANTWGKYWLDNANTATYAGYALLTSVAAGWTFGRHEIVLDVENAFDQRYAMQVQKDVNGRVTYAAGAPRYVSLGYRLGL